MRGPSSAREGTFAVTGYTARDVAKLLDIPVDQVRSFARAGFLEPRRGARGEYRFTFQDLVVMRTAKGLVAQRIPPRKVLRALRKLRERLPRGRPLTALQISAQGDRILVREGDAVWNPESGQAQFDFEVSELAEKAAPLALQSAEEAFASEDDLTAEDWHELGCELETTAPEPARDAYRRALELDPSHVETRVNLGRLLHEVGLVDAAEAHYRVALLLRPDDATAAFNLGVALEDQQRFADALKAYQQAVKNDPKLADAYYNLARLHERAGDDAGALRYMRTYRELTEP